MPTLASSSWAARRIGHTVLSRVGVPRGWQSPVRRPAGSASASARSSAARFLGVPHSRHPSPLLVAATLGDPSRVRVGDDAIVVGNPYALTRSLSTGVVSGLNRSVQASGQGRSLSGLIQFDAAVNPGSSGGPLLNRDGDVVGIVTGLVNPTGSPAFSGIGFAGTIDTASAALGLPPE